MFYCKCGVVVNCNGLHIQNFSWFGEPLCKACGMEKYKRVRYGK